MAGSHRFRRFVSWPSGAPDGDAPHSCCRRELVPQPAPIDAPTGVVGRPPGRYGCPPHLPDPTASTPTPHPAAVATWRFGAQHLHIGRARLRPATSPPAGVRSHGQIPILEVGSRSTVSGAWSWARPAVPARGGLRRGGWRSGRGLPRRFEDQRLGGPPSFKRAARPDFRLPGQESKSRQTAQNTKSVWESLVDTGPWLILIISRMVSAEAALYSTCG